MRITDDRYHRDQQRLDLAMRLIRHEARTATIRAWTGLTGDRIRKLHRQYIRDAKALAERHRGRPPRQSSFFLRNAVIRRQASALGGLYALLGLLHEAAPTSTEGTPPWAETFCDAYETYLTLGLGSDITFEHAAYLLEALQRRVDLRPGCCPVCRAFTLIDTQRRMAPHCALCEDRAFPETQGEEAQSSDPAPLATERARIPSRKRHASSRTPHLRRTLP